MRDQLKSILPKNFSLNEKYTVLLFIKQGNNAETYRVKGKDGKMYFLKLFKIAQMPRTAFDENNNLLEIEILKSINHLNLVQYHESGELIYEGKKYLFLVLNFIVGETLTEKVAREPINSIYDVKQIAIGILEGLNYLHTLSNVIIHNEITPQNIMIDLSSDIPTVKIIDFGYARSFHQSSKNFNKEGLNLNYTASECLNNLFSPQSDIYSVGAIMYYLLFSLPPWFREVSNYQSSKLNLESEILESRKRTLIFNDISEDFFDFEDNIIAIIKKAIAPNLNERFESANDFIDALKGNVKIESIDLTQKQVVNSVVENIQVVKSEKKKGNGFDAIAGMAELKKQLQLDVIDALHNPEQYAEYGVTIPNGMLLYGPPGCGKTFFAKHFAEEVGFNFVLATPSTLKSRYVNATQENIAKMFADAEKNAPTIIFIDEINELLPNRDSDAHEMSKGAVNEMLAQMDRTGEKGIFIIGATNYPDMIDPAMLRSGRLDKKFYLSPPDFEARKAMFEMYLKNRPLDFGMDYDKLAKLTENYVSADIEFLVNEASRFALKEKSRISMSIFEQTIKIRKPSVSYSELQKYEKVRAQMEGENSETITKVGFKTKNDNKNI
jgi:transitional endoplasmic reticulum ATPase